MTVTIENDEKIEETESFSATLERTPDLDDRILLSPVDATISIIDDDGKFMTYTNWLQLMEHYLKNILPTVLHHRCYTGPGCMGPSFPMATARECCVETVEGMSYSEDGVCVVSQCIGMW